MSGFKRYFLAWVRSFALLLAIAVAVAFTVVSVPALRHRLSVMMPHDRLVQLNGLRFGYQVEREVRLRMRDGIQLATSLYLPRERAQPLAAILVRLPYGRLDYGEALNAAEYFARRGYAVVVQDLRGTGDSGGEFVPYRHAVDDGATTLDWIVAQPWSNGRVGSFGCSALGETQHILARAHHPALRAMVPLGAGGAIGSAGRRYAYFGVYEGGIFQLASGFGWFIANGTKDPRSAPATAFDVGAALRELPVASLVQRHRPAPNGYDDFLRMPLSDPAWHELGYLSDNDKPSVPTLEINTWGDQTVGDTLALDAAWRGAGAPPRHLIIAPGTHCHHEEAGDSGRYGELEVRHAAQPYFEWYEHWFDYWLRDRGDGLASMPAVLYYMLGEQRWLSAPSWPPPQASAQRWYLGSSGHANSMHGDGWLLDSKPVKPGHDEFVYDPFNPVPSRGGPLCCTGNLADRTGPVDQISVESRNDVLVYTSPLLQSPLRIAGPLHALLWISSSAVDTDFVARLVDVGPDGRALNIQEGALRARYRQGFEHPQLLKPDEVVALNLDLRSIAYTLQAGHRLRLTVTSSSFPRLERNLNTGGDNARAVQPVRARNSVFHGGRQASYVEIYTLPTAH